MSKSPDAFRTISEVAEWLDTPAHVLRFWESRFRQVKPVKRAGGRRYYRPADMALLGGIKRLLHDDGMTIKGVQKILRDKGVKHVSDLSIDVDSDIEQADIDAAEARLMASIKDQPAKSPEPVVSAPAVDAKTSDDTKNDVADPAPVPEAQEDKPKVTDTPEPTPESVVAKETADAPPKDTAKDATQDPVQLDLLATEPKDEPAPTSEPAPAADEAEAEKVAPPVEDAIDASPKAKTPEAETKAETKPNEPPVAPAPSPITCEVAADPTDEALVVDGAVDASPVITLMSSTAADFAGKTTALQALLDRIKGADGELGDGV